MTSCAQCGRPVGNLTSQSAGRCAKDRIYLCSHCATPLRKCPRCARRTGDPAGTIFGMGVFMTLFIAVFLGGIIFPHAYRNAQLDALPVSALSGVVPGGTYKVFATVGPNQSDVVTGSWVGGGSTWGWTATNFWLAQNGSQLLVNVSELTYVRQPGNPWGSESGTVVYTAGSQMAVYGPAKSSSNGTVLFAQYISKSPSLMGNANDDLWPLVVAFIVGSAVVTTVAGCLTLRHKRENLRAILNAPPSLPNPAPQPSALTGTIHEFPNPCVGRSLRRNRILAAVGGVLTAFGALVTPVNQGFGLFVLIFGPSILITTTLSAYSTSIGVSSVLTDDTGIYIRPWAQYNESIDNYIPWSAIQDYFVYFGSLLTLRTSRGEVSVTGLDSAVRARLITELDWRGVLPGISTTSRASQPTLVTTELSARDQLKLQVRARRLGVAKSVAVLTALLAGPSALTEYSFSQVVGGTLLLIAVASILIALVISSRVTLIGWRVSERIRTSGS